MVFYVLFNLLICMVNVILVEIVSNPTVWTLLSLSVLKCFNIYKSLNIVLFSFYIVLNCACDIDNT